MSASITEPGSPATAAMGSRRRWLMTVKIGVGLMVLAMIIVALVMVDKKHFGWMVGTWFLPIITSGILIGSIILLVGAWKLPERSTWRGRFLLLWALVALTSPAFGYLFLFPWGILAVTLPVVIWILITLSRTSPA